jgi:hypothetical protein
MSTCNDPVKVLSNDAAVELGSGNRGNLITALAFDEQGNFTVFVSNDTKVEEAQFPIPLSETGEILGLKGVNIVQYHGSPKCTTICIPGFLGGPTKYYTICKN